MGQRRWIVQAGDGPGLGPVAARAAPDDPGALLDGRVFVGRERVKDPGRLLRPGDIVTVHARREGAPLAAAGARRPLLIEQRSGVAAFHKPAALSTIADHHGEGGSLVEQAARELGVPSGSLHPTSRLDVGVSGVVLLTLTREARVRLEQAREQRLYRRQYLAVAARAPRPPEGVWDAPIGRAGDPRRRAVGGRDPAVALSRYRVLALGPGAEAMLLLEPETGRTHQLRVHAAHAGAPLLGDGVYGGLARVASASGRVWTPGRIALHALRVTVPDEAGQPWRVTAPPPDDFRAFWEALDGPPSVWESPGEPRP